MNRRTFIVTSAIAILAAPLADGAQPARKVYRIGYLSTQTPSLESARLDAFRQALRDLGCSTGTVRRHR
jgi:hypothetical protein